MGRASISDAANVLGFDHEIASREIEWNSARFFPSPPIHQSSRALISGSLYKLGRSLPICFGSIGVCLAAKKSRQFVPSFEWASRRLRARVSESSSLPSRKRYPIQNSPFQRVTEGDAAPSLGESTGPKIG